MRVSLAPRLPMNGREARREKCSKPSVVIRKHKIWTVELWWSIFWITIELFTPRKVQSEVRRRHSLENVRFTLAIQSVDRRAFVEPPIPGYRGFIPRIQPIDIGLGDRYHEATRKGLNRFAVETTNSMTNFPTNTDVDPSSGQTSNQEK